MHPLNLWPVSVCWALLAACAPDLRLPTEDTAALSERVATERLPAGEYVTRIDASSRELWVHFSLSSGSEVGMPTRPVRAGPQNTAEAGAGPSGHESWNCIEAQDAGAGAALWDLAFQRFHILSNGGASGTADVAILPLPGQPFESLFRAPSERYVQDRPDSSDTDLMNDTAFSMEEGWYTYDSADNTLSPNDVTYAIRSSCGRYFKLRLLSYYDSAGSSGQLSFVWAPLPQPGG